MVHSRISLSRGKLWVFNTNIVFYELQRKRGSIQMEKRGFLIPVPLFQEPNTYQFDNFIHVRDISLCYSLGISARIIHYMFTLQNVADEDSAAAKQNIDDIIQVCVFISCVLSHAQTSLTIFVIVIPKESLVGTS